MDLVQSTVAGDNLLAPPSYSPMQINVAGSIDSVTDYGMLYQVGSFTGYFDVNDDLITDDDVFFWDENDDYQEITNAGSVTISNMAWTLDASGMHLTNGYAEGCNSGSPVCQNIVGGIVAQEIDITSANHSVFDFTGINAGFQTLPKSNLAGTAYGTNAKTWAATPGLAGSWSGFNYTAQLASRVNSGTVTSNVANTATLSLLGEVLACDNGPEPGACGECYYDPNNCNAPTPTVPVTAAGWLMGSGLIGLAGVARRKKSQS